MNETLVERVDIVIADAIMERAAARNSGGNVIAPTITDMAKRVLAALGLDDLDAAVERGARRLLWEQYQGCVSWEDTEDTATTGDAAHRGYALDHARAVLEAALCATDAEGGK